LLALTLTRDPTQVQRSEPTFVIFFRQMETDTRPLCRYPEFARYSGHGSTTKASSFVCAR